MYQLVIIHTNGKEEVVFSTEDAREAELQRQLRVRSLSQGFAEVREVADQPAKKKK